MAKWQVQDAKARFSELLETTLKKGPQVVTRRGVETGRISADRRMASSAGIFAPRSQGVASQLWPALREPGAWHILSMDSASFREWGRLMHGKSDHLIEDGMIAATARTQGLIVATRNENDFKQLNVPVFSPFN